MQQNADEVECNCCLQLTFVRANVSFAPSHGDECLPMRCVLRHPDEVGPGLANIPTLGKWLLAGFDDQRETPLVDAH